MWSGSQYCEVLVLLTQSMKPENYFSVEKVQVRTNSLQPGTAEHPAEAASDVAASCRYWTAGDGTLGQVKPIF